MNGSIKIITIPNRIPTLNDFKDATLIVNQPDAKVYAVRTINSKRTVINIADSEMFIQDGDRYSSVHAGNYKDMSMSDDYMYICVKTGTAGNATWKRFPLTTTT
jgi:hypothetical protein